MSRAVAWAAMLGILVLPRPAAATMRLGDLGLGDLDVSGNLQTQNIIRHPDAERLMFIQQRNTFRLRVDWDLVEDGRLLGRARAPGIRT